MALDNVQNFARTSLAEDLTNSETDVDVNNANDLPDPANGEYNIVVWDDTTHPNPANDPDAEIMRVTAVASNTLTVTRGQEGTSGTAHSSGYAVANLLTAKMINDIDTELGNKAETFSDIATNSTTTTNSLYSMTSAVDVEFEDSGANTLMYLEEGTGNVGIGVTSPLFKLEVDGNIGLTAGNYINWGSTSGSGGYGIRDNGGNLQFKDSGGSWTDFGSGGSGTDVAVDLANDSNDEITALTRINTSNDTNNIVTNNTGSEILIDMSSNWPTADAIASQGALATLDTVGTSEIDSKSVTFTEMQDIGEDTLIGRTSAGSGDPTDLSASQVRTILNVEDGATSDQTAEEIQDAVYNNVLSGTQTLINVTYDDANNEIEYVGDNDLSNYDNSTSGVVTPSSTDTLTNKTLDADGTGNSISNIGADETKLGDGLEGDGSDNIKTSEMYSFTIPTDQWAAGLSNAEIGRKVLQSGETLVIDRIELHQDGGGTSNANMSVRVQDVTASSTIGSTDLNTVTKDPGSSGTANTIAIQITNSTGSQVNANVEVTGRITGA